jgi:hypothetical protein
MPHAGGIHRQPGDARSGRVSVPPHAAINACPVCFERAALHRSLLSVQPADFQILAMWKSLNPPRAARSPHSRAI